MWKQGLARGWYYVLGTFKTKANVSWDNCRNTKPLSSTVVQSSWLGLESAK